MYIISVHVIERIMKRSVTYTRARETLATLCDEVISSREPTVITRRDKDDVAIIAADELSSILETAHLLRSERNTQRLLKALLRAHEGRRRASTVKELRRKTGLDDAQA
jgi:antitoxin YefM